MKIKLILSSLLLTGLYSNWTIAQEGPTVVRSRLCTLNAGYSMTDVVEFARGIDWSAGTPPAAIFFREARAVPGEFQRNWDFVWSNFYSDWNEQYQSISALRNRPGGRTGSPVLFDMITCDARTNIARVTIANQGEIFSNTESTPMGSQFCDLNGATLQDAVTMAATNGQRVGAYSAVDMAVFGGQDGYEASSRVYVRYVFADGQTFANSLDGLTNNPPPSGGPNGISCGTAGLWLSHRIYQQN